MPLLGGLLVSLFAGLAEFFAKWITRKVAVIAAGIAVFASLTGALYLVLSLFVAGIVAAMPMSNALAIGIWLAVPDNGPAVVAACLSADAAITIYRMNMLNVMFGVYAP